MDDEIKYSYLFMGLVIGAIMMALYMRSIIDLDYVLKSDVLEYKTIKQIREDMPKN